MPLISIAPSPCSANRGARRKCGVRASHERPQYLMPGLHVVNLARRPAQYTRHAVGAISRVAKYALDSPFVEWVKQ